MGVNGKMTTKIFKIGRKSEMRECVSFALNALIFVFATVGIIIACFRAGIDGYSHWARRMLYFTQMSNIWIGAVSLLHAVYLFREGHRGEERIPGWFFALKYVFTVSITVTGIIYCGLLAPFADYNVWSFSSILTHVVVPVLSVADLFISRREYKLSFRHSFSALIPPAAYFVFASILNLCGVDFGRGETYPYFFMDLNSPVGLFGFRFTDRPEMGTVYWVLLLLALIYGIAYLYLRLYNNRGKGADE